MNAIVDNMDGHLSIAAINRLSHNTSDSWQCFYCGQQGHIVRDCLSCKKGMSQPSNTFNKTYRTRNGQSNNTTQSWRQGENRSQEEREQHLPESTNTEPTTESTK